MLSTVFPMECSQNVRVNYPWHWLCLQSQSVVDWDDDWRYLPLLDDYSNGGGIYFTQSDKFRNVGYQDQLHIDNHDFWLHRQVSMKGLHFHFLFLQNSYPHNISSNISILATLWEFYCLIWNLSSLHRTKNLLANLKVNFDTINNMLCAYFKLREAFSFSMFSIVKSPQNPKLIQTSHASQKSTSTDQQ